MPQVAMHGKKTEAGYNAAVYFNDVQINNSDFTIRDGTENDLRDLYVRAAESYRMNPSVPAEWSDIFTSEFLEKIRSSRYRRRSLAHPKEEFLA